jgi:hypothetical protein
MLWSIYLVYWQLVHSVQWHHGCCERSVSTVAGGSPDARRRRSGCGGNLCGGGTPGAPCADEGRPLAPQSHSVAAQGFDGIDARSAPRRHVTRQLPDDHQGRRHYGERADRDRGEAGRAELFPEGARKEAEEPDEGSPSRAPRGHAEALGGHGGGALEPLRFGGQRLATGGAEGVVAALQAGMRRHDAVRLGLPDQTGGEQSGKNPVQ